jgi:hypothetical protein
VNKYRTVVQATEDNIIRRMHTACWLTKATDTHSEYLMLLAFAPQLLRESPSMLCYTYIAYTVFVACCAGRGLCDGPINRPEESYRAPEPHCVR